MKAISIAKKEKQDGSLAPDTQLSPFSAFILKKLPTENFLARVCEDHIDFRKVKIENRITKHTKKILKTSDDCLIIKEDIFPLDL